MNLLNTRRVALALSILAMSASPLWAQEDEEETTAAPAPAPKKEKKEEVAGTGDVVGYKFPRGIYTQSDLGVFWRYLGFSDLTGTPSSGSVRCQSTIYRCKYPTYLVSNAQPYLGFSVGYDLPIPEKLRIGVSGQLNVGAGFVANAAPYSTARSKALNEGKAAGDASAVRSEESPKDHAILMLTPALAVNVIPPPFERVVLEARVFAGGAAFSPSAQRFQTAGGNLDLTNPRTNWLLGTFGLNGGVGLSGKYMTLLTNFVIGFDLALYTLFSPGWGTEIYFALPYNYKVSDQQQMPFVGPFPGGFSGGGTNSDPVLVLPFIWATSFSPIIIKYVF
ncbi:MAG: hypothetical protein AB2A00_42620 [Myxococcota bacterium]